MKRRQNNQLVSHDLPHEHLMDEHNIEFNELNSSIQKDIRNCDELFKTAMKDGYINDNEEKELITTSYKISQRIKSEHPDKLDGKDSSGMLAGIVTGVGIALLALFGINQIRQK